MSQAHITPEQLAADPFGERNNYAIWEAPAEVVALIPAAQFDKCMAELAAYNHQSHLVLATCLWCGTPEMVDAARVVMLKHEREGSLSHENGYRRQAISTKLAPLAASKRAAAFAH